MPDGATLGLAVGPRFGRVAQYDTAAGYGTITDDRGAAFWFHCTAVADGSRHIEPETVVVFSCRPGAQGRWEAAAITPRLVV
jgi:cold shock CspA family protein